MFFGSALDQVDFSDGRQYTLCSAFSIDVHLASPGFGLLVWCLCRCYARTFCEKRWAALKKFVAIDQTTCDSFSRSVWLLAFLRQLILAASCSSVFGFTASEGQPEYPYGSSCYWSTPRSDKAFENVWRAEAEAIDELLRWSCAMLMPVVGAMCAIPGWHL